MLSRIKKTFLSFFRLNKKAILVLLFFVFLGTLLPFCFAEASWLERQAQRIIAWGVRVIFDITATIVGIIVFIPWRLLTLVTSPWFLDIPYTTNEFVMLGWTLVRDLVNMFFILILVVIALATILRISEYEVKKTLPLLIIIILLINFTPVITGLIIDFFNVFKDFFLGEGIGIDALYWATEEAIARVEAEIREFDWADVLHIPILVIGGVVLIIISGLLLALIFFLFALLFAIRPIALMLLVILSPIAFLAYILPATRGFFNQWWNQFIQWCFIGVTGAFFLYLTDQFAYLLLYGEGELQRGVVDLTVPEGAEERMPGMGGLLAGFVPMFLILGFMVLGFFFTVTTGATGASHVIRFGKGVGRWTARTLQVKAGVYGAKAISRGAFGLEKGAEKLRDKGIKRGGLRGRVEAGVGTAVGRVSGWAARSGAEKARREAETRETGFKREEQEERNRIIKMGSDTDKVHALRASIAKGAAAKAFEALGVTQTERKKKLESILKTAKGMGIGLEKDIELAYPHLIPDPEKKREAIKAALATPESFKNMDIVSALDDPDIQEGLTTATPSALSNVARVNPQALDKMMDLWKRKLDEYTKMAKDNRQKGIEMFKQKHPQVARFLTGVGIHRFGIEDILESQAPPRRPEEPPEEPPEPGWTRGPSGLWVPPPK